MSESRHFFRRQKRSIKTGDRFKRRERKGTDGRTAKWQRRDGDAGSMNESDRERGVGEARRS